MPTTFNPTDPKCLQDFGTQNCIDPDLLQLDQWLGNPLWQKKTNGSLVLQLLDKNIAIKMECSGLFYQNGLYHGAHYVRSIPQCFRCWKMGHTAQWCKNPPLCKKCNIDHGPTSCHIPLPSPPKCCICAVCKKLVSNKFVNTLDDDKFSHHPWSITCPMMSQEIQNWKRRRWNS